VRLGLILYLTSLLTPAAPRLEQYPPQTVRTAHPILCAHTRLTDEVEAWKIQKTLQLVREMGATTIVELFPWAYIEGQQGRFDWSHPDRIINLARHEGLRVIARLGVVPEWGRYTPAEWSGPADQRQPRPLYTLPPERYADYAAFVGAFAARYRGVVDHIVPWNEPNLSFEWGGRRVSPAEYADFLKLIHAAAHAANPDVMILGAALAPTLEPETSAVALDDVIFLRQLYAAGGGAAFDALAVHTYGFTLPADDPPARDRLNFRRYELLREVMREFGDGDKPVYITESSWNDHPRWNNAVTPGERITNTLAAIRLAEERWPAVRALCFWYFRAPVPTRSHPDYFAFVTSEFRLKPIYLEVKGMAQNLTPQPPLPDAPMNDSWCVRSAGRWERGSPCVRGAEPHPPAPSPGRGVPLGEGRSARADDGVGGAAERAL
jgi:hypothetical protein